MDTAADTDGGRKKARKHVAIGYDAGDDAGTAAAGQTTSNGILPSRSLPGMARQDNAALALHTITAGTPLIVDGKTVCAESLWDVPEGHRFACEAIAKGEPIRSWGLPFGVALRDIAAGEYLCNLKVLGVFRDRQSTLKLPVEANMANIPFKRFQFDDAAFTPAGKTADPTIEAGEPVSFEGYLREGGRGTGTRNYVVVIGISSQAGSFAKAVEAHFKRKKGLGCDGVVAVAHTEGGLHAEVAAHKPNNHLKVLRTLAGFALHPNVGAVLFADHPSAQLRTDELLEFMEKNGYNLDLVPHRAISLGHGFQNDVMNAVGLVEELLPLAATAQRTARPLAEVKLAQQCGGSDAFSGISANPLAGWIARRLCALGGSALLAETDELIGAESYILSKLADRKTAHSFLQLISRFYRYTGRFGHSPEGNPSGGNLFRGLYNITLKSVGAAMKKLPGVVLASVIEYGAPLKTDGYSFMDSPGNDMESIAGQVAAGCNIIMFTTGNGSITNFPFVPTIKVLTTSKRYELLSRDMDVNAGQLLDGMTIDQLGKQTFELLSKIVSGHKSKGELAGHHQVQIWRTWAKTDGDEADAMELDVDLSTAEQPKESATELVTREQVKKLTGDNERSGEAFMPSSIDGIDAVVAPLKNVKMIPVKQGEHPDAAVKFVSERVGMVVPTSLCSSGVAQQMAEKLQTGFCKPDSIISRVITLPHTEGCGHSSGENEAIFLRTILGYATHPMVAYGSFLEHGCEKTHNGRINVELKTMDIDRTKFDYTSVQLDGGIESATNKVGVFFTDRLAALSSGERTTAPTSSLRIGLVSNIPVPANVLRAFGVLACGVAQLGGTVVACGTVGGAHFLHEVLQQGADADQCTLGYGQRATKPGIHLMHNGSTKHLVELTTGLGASGVEVIVTYVKGQAVQSHPLIPTLQVTLGKAQDADIDIALATSESGEASDATERRWAATLAEQITQVLSRDSTPKLFNTGNWDFQLTRGFKGVSL